MAFLSAGLSAEKAGSHRDKMTTGWELHLHQQKKKWGQWHREKDGISKISDRPQIDKRKCDQHTRKMDYLKSQTNSKTTSGNVFNMRHKEMPVFSDKISGSDCCHNLEPPPITTTIKRKGKSSQTLGISILILAN